VQKPGQTTDDGKPLGLGSILLGIIQEIGIVLIVILQLVIIWLMLNPSAAQSLNIGGNVIGTQPGGENFARMAAAYCNDSYRELKKITAALQPPAAGSGADCTLTTLGGRTIVIMRNGTQLIGVPGGSGGQGAPGSGGTPGADGAPGAPGGSNGQPPSGTGSNGSQTYPGEDPSTMEGDGTTQGGTSPTSPPGTNGCYTMTICDTPQPTCPEPTTTTDSCQNTGSMCGYIGSSFYGECCNGQACTSNICGGGQTCSQQGFPCGPIYSVTPTDSNYTSPPTYAQCCGQNVCVGGTCQPPAQQTCHTQWDSCITTADCCGAMVCQNGYCYNGTTQPTPGNCTDTDGGRNYTRQGTATGSYNGYNGNYTDMCDTGMANTLYEYYCDGSLVRSSPNTCQFGCYLGACRTQEACIGNTMIGLFVRGSVSFGGQSYNDYCISNDTSYKYYCSGNNVSHDTRYCMYGCGNGVCNPAPQAPPTTPPAQACSDSDGGLNANQSGTASGRNGLGINGSWSDYCSGSVSLFEYYCDAGGIVQQNYIACPSNCISGQCMPAQQQQSQACSETDNGDDINNGGTLTQSGLNYTDFCQSGTSVWEYYCLVNGFNSHVVSCPSGYCSNGECLTLT